MKRIQCTISTGKNMPYVRIYDVQFAFAAQCKYEQSRCQIKPVKISKISYCHVASSSIYQNKNHIYNLLIIQWPFFKVFMGKKLI